MAVLPRRRRIRLPITLSVSLMTVNVVLMVCWIVLLARLNYWSFLTIGTVLFSLALVGLGVYLFVTLKEIQLNQRQANFVDSVTHELKSPIASIRLYLETMQIREVTEEQRQSFLATMARDLNRLEHLIEHLLEIGRLDAIVPDGPLLDIPLEPILRESAAAACKHYQRPLDCVRFDLEPCVVKGGQLALEMIFNNLIDNAIKYGGEQPLVEVEARAGRGKVVVRVADNGRGVPVDLRKKIFGLFFRGGDELKRTTKGTGLGLFIVHTLVKKLRGKISVHGRTDPPGAVFEVSLPGRAVGAVEPRRHSEPALETILDAASQGLRSSAAP